ncbi:MAG: hypothetical protein HY558_02780 [Euryarchaeota archaeon]|nr:hypothetical protein [Euryarchaeota archaeon]
MASETPPGPTASPRGEEPASILDRVSLVGMGLLLLTVQGGALVLSLPFQAAVPKEYQAFENPADPTNVLYLVAIMLAFTGFFLLLIKWGSKAALRALMYGLIGYLLFSGLLLALPHLYGLAALGAAAALTLALYRYPEWWLVDSVMLPTGAFATWLFGISLTAPVVLLALIALAVYDFIAVYRTGHMVTLAEGVMDLKIPILFVLPRKRHYSFRGQTGLSSDAYYMGLGDAIIPGMLAVTANLPSVNPNLAQAPFLGPFTLPAVTTLLGILGAFIALSFIVGKGKPHAGLPFLNTGASAGFLIGIAMSRVALF